MIPPTTAKADLVLSTNVGSFVQRASSALRQQLLQMMDTKLGRAWRVEYTPGKHSWTEKCVLQKNRPLLGAKNGDSIRFCSHPSYPYFAVGGFAVISFSYFFRGRRFLFELGCGEDFGIVSHSCLCFVLWKNCTTFVNVPYARNRSLVCRSSRYLICEETETECRKEGTIPSGERGQRDTRKTFDAHEVVRNNDITKK